jgi:hypothetical protein
MAKKLTAETIKLPSALHLPVRVLAQLPEKLTELGIAIAGSASLIPRSQEEEERIASFTKAHTSVAVAYDDANDTAKGIVDALSEITGTVTGTVVIAEEIYQAATSAKTLTSVIGKVCVDIHQAQRFRSIFSDQGTVNATVAALCAHAEEISTTLKKFVY